MYITYTVCLVTLAGPLCTGTLSNHGCSRSSSGLSSALPTHDLRHDDRVPPVSLMDTYTG